MSRWLWTAELWTPMNITNGVPGQGRTADPSGPAVRGLPTAVWLTDGLQKRLQLLRPRGVSKLPQRLRLDLPDALARHVERPADLFERVLRAIADAKAHLQDLLLPGRQGLEHPAGLVLEVRDQHGVDRREDLAILDEIAQMR